MRSPHATPEAVWRNELGGLHVPRRGSVPQIQPARQRHRSRDRARAAGVGGARTSACPRCSNSAGTITGRCMVTRALDAEGCGDRSAGASTRRCRSGDRTRPARAARHPAGRRAARSTGRAESRGAANPPPIDRLVVCHGDACAPNFLIARRRRARRVRRPRARSGVADRWADLAVASMSLRLELRPAERGRVLGGIRHRSDAERIASTATLERRGPAPPGALTREP